jgi:hypothetical protein
VIGHQSGAELLQGAAGEFVLEVEIGCDDEKAVVRESVEGTVEHALPEFGSVPEVLVPQERDVELVGAGQAIKEGEAIPGVEGGPDSGSGGGHPAGPRCIDLRGAQVGTDDFEGLVPWSEEVGKDSGFVGPPAGEVEKTPVAGLVGEHVFKRSQAGFQCFPEVRHVLIGLRVGKAGCGGATHMWAINDLDLQEFKVEGGKSSC